MRQGIFYYGEKGNPNAPAVGRSGPEGGLKAGDIIKAEAKAFSRGEGGKPELAS